MATAADLIKNQNIIRIGDVAPDFTAKTTKGDISFHEWSGNSWTILFSHPRAETPICTTELSVVAKLKDTWEALGVKVIGLSVDDVEENVNWGADIEKYGGAEVFYPIICDKDYAVSLKYGMVNQDHILSTGLPATVRSVYFIDPSKKVQTILTYPASVGRNFDEIVRIVTALQVVSTHKVACPVGWNKGNKCVVPPFVTTEEAKTTHGEVDIVFPYLRFVEDPSSKQ